METIPKGQAAAGSRAQAGAKPKPLLSCMASNSDFPALSSIIGEINEVVASESESVGKLAQTVLKDFALTNKLLKLVNTVSYSQFGGNINTISKAVTITGFEAVRNIAMTLTLLEYLQNKNQAAELKDEIIFALLAGEVSVKLSRNARQGFAEEEWIVSMFHSLGKLLVTLYCFEESRNIARLAEEQGVSDEQAAFKVLGMSYNDLGISVARSWNFPARMITAMRKLEKGKVSKPHGGVDSVSVCANLANELVKSASVLGPREKGDALRQLCVRYADVVPDVSVQMLLDALKDGLLELVSKSDIFEIDAAESPLLRRVSAFVGHPDLIGNDAGRPAVQAADMHALDDIETAVTSVGEIEQDKPEYMLSAGIQDVMNTLMDEYSLNDVLNMVMETIHRSMGFDRTMIFLRDARSTHMAARFGLGKDVGAIMPRCRFQMAFEPDVFHLALDQAKDMMIEDAQAVNVSGKIPAWYRDAVHARWLLLLPIVVNGQAVGLIYADVLGESGMQITQQQLIMLRTLRNQLVLAFRQKP